MIVTLRNTSCFSMEHCNRDKNTLPIEDKAVKGLVESATTTSPGIIPSSNSPVLKSASACIIAVKQSVVGSGPILIPGYPLSSRYLINDVFPTEYWPTTSSNGFESKSPSWSGGEWRSWNWYASSNGLSFFVYRYFNPEETLSKTSGL